MSRSWRSASPARSPSPRAPMPQASSSRAASSPRACPSPAPLPRPATPPWSQQPGGDDPVEGKRLQADVTAIDLNYEFEGTATDAFGRPMSGGNGGNAGDVTPVPAISYVRKLDNGVALGAMISAPFGLKTEYDDNWVGRYFAHTSDVQIVDLALSGALDLSDRFSVGLGVIVSRADVTLSRSVDFGTLLYSNPQTRPLPFAQPQAADGSSRSGRRHRLWLAGGRALPPDRQRLDRRELPLGDRLRTARQRQLTVPGNRGRVRRQPDDRPALPGRPWRRQPDHPSVLSIGAHWRSTTASPWPRPSPRPAGRRCARCASSSTTRIRTRSSRSSGATRPSCRWAPSTSSTTAGPCAAASPTTRPRPAWCTDPAPARRRPSLVPIGATWAVSDQLDVNFAFSHLKPDDPRVDITSSGSRIVGRSTAAPTCTACRPSTASDRRHHASR